MGGMGGSTSSDPAVVSAFHRALWHGGLVVAVLALAVLVVWQMSRRRQLLRALASPSPDAPPGDAPGEPTARRFLRIGFGLLWVFDGVLQGQPSMPLGMVPRVIRPAAAGSPAWVRHMVASASAVWTGHPVSAAASTVWIQVGIGLWLMVGGRGMLSQWAAAASAAWGTVVWVLGESFGAILAPGSTWMFGAPGAVLFYVAAGGLIALPERVWRSPGAGRSILRVLGGFFAGMAVLQAWPGRGFWRGGAGGALAAMLRSMAATPQPRLLASIVGAFSRFDASHGWAVNLFLVIALLAVGGALASGRPDVVRAALVPALVLCAADWVLVQDLGFLGGTGTDPNSMVPIGLLAVCGYLGLAPSEPGPGPAGWRDLLRTDPAYAVRASAALAALGVTALGALPMALAAL